MKKIFTLITSIALFTIISAFSYNAQAAYLSMTASNMTNNTIAANTTTLPFFYFNMVNDVPKGSTVKLTINGMNTAGGIKLSNIVFDRSVCYNGSCETQAAPFEFATSRSSGNGIDDITIKNTKTAVIITIRADRAEGFTANYNGSNCKYRVVIDSLKTSRTRGTYAITLSTPSETGSMQYTIN